MRKVKSINKNPLITVITPTYNRAHFLEKTILSILYQGYKNLEYIVLDDGSTDETSRVVERYKNQLTYVYHKNIGEVLTVNKGFSMARGELIGVVNSDDLLLPGALRTIASFMVDNPHIIVGYPDWVKIDENGKELQRVITADYNYEYMLKRHDCIPGPGTFFRKEILDQLQGRDPHFIYVSDYDFWLRAGLIGQFARIPKTLAAWRSHSETTTYKNKGYKMAVEHIHVLNKLYSLPHLPTHIKKIKSDAYASACEAARICRGSNLGTKVLVSLLSLYYSPIHYIKLFTGHRLIKLREILRAH